MQLGGYIICLTLYVYIYLYLYLYYIYTYKDITGLILENNGCMQCNEKGQENAVKGDSSNEFLSLLFLNIGHLEC